MLAGKVSDSRQKLPVSLALRQKSVAARHLKKVVARREVRDWGKVNGFIRFDGNYDWSRIADCSNRICFDDNSASGQWQ